MGSDAPVRRGGGTRWLLTHAGRHLGRRVVDLRERCVVWACGYAVRLWILRLLVVDGGGRAASDELNMLLSSRGREYPSQTYRRMIQTVGSRENDHGREYPRQTYRKMVQTRVSSRARMFAQARTPSQRDSEAGVVARIGEMWSALFSVYHSGLLLSGLTCVALEPVSWLVSSNTARPLTTLARVALGV